MTSYKITKDQQAYIRLRCEQELTIDILSLTLIELVNSILDNTYNQQQVGTTFSAQDVSGITGFYHVDVIMEDMASKLIITSIMEIFADCNAPLLEVEGEDVFYHSLLSQYLDLDVLIADKAINVLLIMYGETTCNNYQIQKFITDHCTI